MNLLNLFNHDDELINQLKSLPKPIGFIRNTSVGHSKSYAHKTAHLQMLQKKIPIILDTYLKNVFTENISIDILHVDNRFKLVACVNERIFRSSNYIMDDDIVILEHGRRTQIDDSVVQRLQRLFEITQKNIKIRQLLNEGYKYHYSAKEQKRFRTLLEKIHALILK